MRKRPHAPRTPWSAVCARRDPAKMEPPMDADTRRKTNHPYRSAWAGPRNRIYAQDPKHREDPPPTEADTHRAANHPHRQAPAVPEPCSLPCTASRRDDRRAGEIGLMRNTPCTVRTCRPWTPMHTEKQTTPIPTHRRPRGNRPARKTPCTVRTRRPSDRAPGQSPVAATVLGRPKAPRSSHPLKIVT